MENLIALQNLQLKPGKPAAGVPEEINRLRGTVPEPVLAHFDRMLARGKKGVAIVRNGVCTGCHLKISSGTLGNLPDTTAIHLCDSCGRYLYLAPDAIPLPPKAPVATRRPRARKSAEPALV